MRQRPRELRLVSNVAQCEHLHGCQESQGSWPTARRIIARRHDLQSQTTASYLTLRALRLELVTYRFACVASAYSLAIVHQA